ncbi:tail terminator [Microbacterium phage Zanella]|nr:tail terminator [Microbacterium phage Zanella]
MSFTEDLINGVAEYLASNPSANPQVYFDATGQYPENQWGIFALSAPIKRNQRSLVIAPFSPEAPYSSSDDVVSVQLDYYGPALEVVRVMDDAFDRLQAVWAVTMGGIKVQSIGRTSSARLGFDEAGNYRHTQNYDLAVYRPSSHRQ